MKFQKWITSVTLLAVLVLVCFCKPIGGAAVSDETLIGTAKPITIWKLRGKGK